MHTLTIIFNRPNNTVPWHTDVVDGHTVFARLMKEFTNTDVFPTPGPTPQNVTITFSEDGLSCSEVHTSEDFESLTNLSTGYQNTEDNYSLFKLITNYYNNNGGSVVVTLV
jgi:hypothetical protein